MCLFDFGVLIVTGEIYRPASRLSSGTIARMKATRIPFSGQWLDAPGVAHTPTKLDRFADLAGVPESVARHGDEWVRHWLGRRVSLGGDDGESMADVRTFARDKLAWLRDRHKGRRKPCP